MESKIQSEIKPQFHLHLHFRSTSINLMELILNWQEYFHKEKIWIKIILLKEKE